jgi:Domain of unknown function (DUF4232)
MMSEDRTTLEHMLRARAAEVPHLQAVPPTMLARARRRIARNALASVVAAGLIVVGASAGLTTLGALRSPDRVVPEGSSGQHSPAPPASNPSCSAADLRATARLEGAAGSVLGSVDITNLGAEVCTLTGRPVVTIFTSAGDQLSPHVQEVPPQWQVDGRSPPQGWPVVSLRPGAAAAIRIRWNDPCPQLSDPAVWSVGLSGGGTLDVGNADTTPPPPCLGTAEPSMLEVGPFEPSPG